MKELTYEQAISRLEEIVNQLENNDVSLEKSISLFQEGIELSKLCDSKLKNIQKKVAQIYEEAQLKDIETEE